LFLTLLLLLALGAPASAAPPRKKAAPTRKTPAKAPEEPPPDSVVPDLSRFFDTWLWVKSDGVTATSSPSMKGAARTLVLGPDLTYEFHQRRDTRDSILCRGSFNFSEESGQDRDPVDFLDFGGWYESYEHRMIAEFAGPDTLLLVGDRCDNCPEHTFVRGTNAIFEGSVAGGQPYRHDLWDGLRFELVPVELGWKIAIRDTTRPEEDLASLTPPWHFVPNPTQIEGWHFCNKENTGPNQGDVNAPGRTRDFIFSPEVGRSIQGPGASTTEEEVERVGDRGRGVLEIEAMELTPPAKNARAGIQSMRFRVAIEEVRARLPGARRAP
jgi:hypothetical protein